MHIKAAGIKGGISMLSVMMYSGVGTQQNKLQYQCCSWLALAGTVIHDLPWYHDSWSKINV